MNQGPQKPGRLILLLWGLAATLIAMVFAAASVVLFLQLRSSAAHLAAMQTSPFLKLREEAVVGRYRWIEEGVDHGVITLLPDHSFIAMRGERARFHQWEIGREALFVVWLSGIDRFTNIEAPGVYTATRPDGRVIRMEKEP